MAPFMRNARGAQTASANTADWALGHTGSLLASGFEPSGKAGCEYERLGSFYLATAEETPGLCVIRGRDRASGLDEWPRSWMRRTVVCAAPLFSARDGCEWRTPRDRRSEGRSRDRCGLLGLDATRAAVSQSYERKDERLWLAVLGGASLRAYMLSRSAARCLPHRWTSNSVRSNR
jgi:hypothetical protein